MIPKAAAALGADVLVIGRPITQARRSAGGGAGDQRRDRRGAGGLTMPVAVKICGLTDAAALDAAVERRRPLSGVRVLSAVAARAQPSSRLPSWPAARRPTGSTVGVFVDPDDDLLDRTLAQVPLEAVQLHGAESPGARPRDQGADRARRDQGAQGGRA